MRFDAHFGTFDADAIETALNLASISQSRGPKTVFVLTDGYGTRGNLFVKALQRAENEGVEVIGVSVGFSKTLVSEVYQHYIVAAFPSVLPDALQAYAEQETEGAEEKEILDETNIVLADARDTVGAVLADAMTVFPKLHEQMRGERDLKLVKGNAPCSSTTVDLCFVIDCTGSMAPYLQAVIAQVKGCKVSGDSINLFQVSSKASSRPFKRNTLRSPYKCATHWFLIVTSRTIRYLILTSLRALLRSKRTLIVSSPLVDTIWPRTPVVLWKRHPL